MEILQTLGIDTGVMLAQALNFFALLAILTFLIYKPVLRLLDARKKRIAAAEAKAQEIEAKLIRTNELTQKELQKAQAKAQEILTAARVSAKQQETELLALAEEKFDRLIAEGRALIAKERAETSAQIQKEVASTIILATEKILTREIKPQDQAQTVQNALNEIAKLQ